MLFLVEGQRGDVILYLFSQVVYYCNEFKDEKINPM